MFGTFATILLVLTLVFGGSGVTVAAAQTSLPDEPLYGLKLLSEDVQVQLSAGPEAKLEVQLRLLERRMNEIREMIAQGETPSEEVMLRLQSQVEQTMRLAVGMPENEALRSMSLVQERLRLMDQTVSEDLTLLVDETVAPGLVMTQVRAMLQERINWIEDSTDDPDHLRQMLHDRDRDQTDDPTQDRLRDRDRDQLNICEDCTPEVTPQGEYPLDETSPSNRNGYGEQPEEAPVPGPGPQNTDNPGPGPAEQPEPAQPGPKSSEDAPKNGKP